LRDYLPIDRWNARSIFSFVASQQACEALRGLQRLVGGALGGAGGAGGTRVAGGSGVGRRLGSGGVLRQQPWQQRRQRRVGSCSSWLVQPEAVATMIAAAADRQRLDDRGLHCGVFLGM
jgi:hypothetical protein